LFLSILYVNFAVFVLELSFVYYYIYKAYVKVTA